MCVRARVGGGGVCAGSCLMSSFSLIKYEVCEICRFSSSSMPFGSPHPCGDNYERFDFTTLCSYFVY